MTTPYYTDELVTLYHGDAREIPEWQAADVLLMDPPYGQEWRSRDGWTNAAGQGGHRSTGQATEIDGDHDTTLRDDLLQLWGGDRPAIVFGNLLLTTPAGAVHVLIYRKPEDAGIRGARAGRRKDVEGIYLCGPWNGSGIGGRTSVLYTSGRVAGPRGIGTRAGHPHAKPLDVLGELVALTPPGTIADPCAGSGQTLIAASHVGRPSIGVEVSERHAENIARRLQQRTLFTDGAS